MPESDVLVSVVVPTRNRAAMLGRAYATIRQQTLSRLETIVVDDASTDGTGDVLAALQASDPRLRVIRNPHPLGGAAARNQGIAAARGRWVAFLDDDDAWLPEKVEQQLALMEAHPGAVAASCAFYVHRFALPTRTVRAPEPLRHQQLLAANVLGGASVCIADAQTLRRIGGFDATLSAGQDWDLWLRLLASGPIVTTREPLVRYEAHMGARISRNGVATYRGRRRLYFRYRPRMEPETRRATLTMLLFCRATRAGTSLKYAVRSWRMIQARTTGLRSQIRYAAWFFLARLPAIGR